MSNNITKRNIVNRLVSEGFSFEAANKAVNAMLACMRESLVEGKSVQLHKIATIKPELREGEVSVIFGKEVQTHDRVKLKIETSRTLHTSYEQKRKADLATSLKSLFE